MKLLLKTTIKFYEINDDEFFERTLTSDSDFNIVY